MGNNFPKEGVSKFGIRTHLSDVHSASSKKFLVDIFCITNDYQCYSCHYHFKHHKGEWYLLFSLEGFLSIFCNFNKIAFLQQSSDLFPDIICYTVPLLVVWISLFAAFKEDFVKKHPYVPFVASCIAIFSLIIAGT